MRFLACRLNISSGVGSDPAGRVTSLKEYIHIHIIYIYIHIIYILTIHIYIYIWTMIGNPNLGPTSGSPAKKSLSSLTVDGGL